MANCHNLFMIYDESLILTDERKASLRISRDDLRKKIRNYFKNEKPNEIQPKFSGQGSFVMDTIINPPPIDDKVFYDIDDGVYFIGDENPDTRKAIGTYHSWIAEAVKKHTSTEPELKNTCVRVIFADGHHIDFPIYYKQNNVPELAHKSKGWVKSDPKEFIEWFASAVKSNPQIKRLVRYLKGWADYKSSGIEMPSGLILTILTVDNVAYNERDDIALRDTLAKIGDSLNLEFTCKRPTTPKGEDLFASYSPTRKTYFLDSLKSLVDSANLAIENPNQKDACFKWQKHFGDRFPCHLAKDEIEDSKAYLTAPMIRQNAQSA